MPWGRLLVVLASFAAPAARGAVPAPTAADRPLREDEVISALIEGLDDADGEVRYNVAAALANLGWRAVPALIEALSHDMPERRAGAAQALSQIRPPAHSAVPALLKALKDDNDLVRRHVSYALSRIVGRDAASAPPPTPPLPPLDPTPAPASGGPR